VLEENHSFFATLKAASKPLILIGQGALMDERILPALAHLAEKIGAAREDWNGFAVLHQAAARVGGTGTVYKRQDLLMPVTG